MNKHLKNAEATTGTPARRDPAPSRFGGSHRPFRKPWINWLVVAGLLFGAYIYLGHHFLRPEYTWAQISGTVSGQTMAAATTAATAAEAAKAAAVTKEAEMAKIAPAVELIKATTEAEAKKAATVAAEAERAKIEPAVELIKATTEAEAKKAALVAKEVETAKIAPAVEQARLLSAIDVAKQAATDTARAYQTCKDRAVANAQNAAINAQSSGGGRNGEIITFGHITAAYDAAIAFGQGSCEPFKEQYEAALKAAEEAASSAKKIQ